MHLPVGVYCTVCKKDIPYHSTKNSKAVQRHMEQVHSQMVENFLQKEVQSGAKSLTMEAFYPVQVGKQTKEASAVNIDAFNRLVSIWTATSLRPFSIVEDCALQEIISFAGRVHGDLKLPSRNTNQQNVVKEAKVVEDAIVRDIKASCSTFSMTTDMWSSRTRKAFMALTITFLTEEFDLRNYTLEVKPVVGKHTGEMILQELQQSLSKWGLSSSDLSMMLRDSGSNIVKACNDWKINHFPCIGHTLHLIVGPFLVPKKKKSKETPKKSSNNADEGGVKEQCATREGQDDGNGAEAKEQCATSEGQDDSNGADDETEEAAEDMAVADDAYEDSYNELILNDGTMVYVCSVVQEVRTICSFIKNSTKSIEILARLQEEWSDFDAYLHVKLDVRTRWNSTLAMLNRMIELQEPMERFLAFFESSSGRREFRGIKTKLSALSQEKWALIHGLCILLFGFDKVTRLLSGEVYSTFCGAMPLLRQLKTYICDENMFQLDRKSSSKVRRFHELYGDMEFFSQLVEKLEVCRMLLCHEFKRRFSGLNIDLLWTSTLDPRYGLHSSHWRDKTEKDKVKDRLIKEVVKAAQHEEAKHPQEERISLCSSSESDSDDGGFSFGPQKKKRKKRQEEQKSTVSQEDRLKSLVTHEVTSYFCEVEALKEVKCELLWWKSNRARFPNIALVARKWLGVVATSTPSERVFSICGVVDTARRSRLTGKSIEKQVFLHNNYFKVNQLK